jgi:SAM-dependent methyltransferase
MSKGDLKRKFEETFELYLSERNKNRPRMIDSAEVEINYMLYMKRRFLETALFINEFSDRRIRILDIGTSPFTFMISDIFGHNVSTVDINDIFKKYSESKGVVFKECDLSKQSVPFGDCSFDIVLFNEVWEHLATSPDAVLKKLSRVLGKNGVLMIQTPNFACLYNRMKLLLGSNVQESAKSMLGDSRYGSGHFREYTMSECLDIIKKSGMRPINSKYAFYNDRPSILFQYITNPTSEKKPTKIFTPMIPFYSLVVLIFPPLRRSILIVCKKP